MSKPGTEVKKMKNRNRQRINRRIKEEMLNPKNEYGAKDPTAYEAVRSIINRERALTKRQSSAYKAS